MPAVRHARRTAETTGYSAAVPLRFDASRLVVALVHLEAEDPGFSSNPVSASYSRSLPYDVSLFATAFVDLDETEDLGVYVGLTRPLGERITASAIVNNTQRGFGFGAEVSRSMGLEPGSYGWQVRVTEGAQQVGAVSYRASIEWKW